MWQPPFYPFLIRILFCQPSRGEGLRLRGSCIPSRADCEGHAAPRFATARGVQTLATWWQECGQALLRRRESGAALPQVELRVVRPSAPGKGGAALAFVSTSFHVCFFFFSIFLILGLYFNFLNFLNLCTTLPNWLHCHNLSFSLSISVLIIETLFLI